MKKVLAIFLCAVLICIGVAPMSSAANGPQLTTKVSEGNYSSSASEAATITKTTFTVVVAAPRNTKKLVGVNLYFEFDPAVLAVAKAGLATTGEATNFNGIFVSGLKAGSQSQYALAWISNDGVSKNQATDLMYVTFNVLDTTVTQTSLNLYIDEYRTDDGVDTNDITGTQLYENKIINFSFPEDTPPATTAPIEEDEGQTDTINALLQLIRDVLNGNGITLADLADALANVYGNAEIADIIEQLVDGNLDISNGLLGLLKSLGIDFDALEELLNKILEFIKDLLEKPSDTTAPGSNNGSEETGDIGIAIAATVCVLSSAAFVLTRKKKDENEE